MEGIARSNVSVVTAVHGIGGVGKSQLAAKYFNDHQHAFDFAVWVDMRERHGRTIFEMIATALDLPKDNSADLVEAARNHIKGGPDSWLLVFDNCDHPSHLDSLLPQSPNAKVIVTSRYRHWADYATSVAVDVFDHSTAVTYLCERAQQTPNREAGDLATGLGCLPLALSLAGSYCFKQQLNFRTYHQQLRAHVTAGLASSDAARTDQAVRGLWEQSLSAAVTADTSASALMEFLCVLDWTDIDRQWLSTHYRSPNLGVLFEYSLIELTQSQISVKHNLIADGVASNLTDRSALQEKLIEVFRGAITDTGPDLQTAETLAEPVRHLEHLTKNHPHLVTPRLIPILNQAVWQLQDQGTAKTEFADRVHQLSRTLNGPDHPDTLGAALRLSATYWSAGDYRRAVDIEQPTLANCERILGPDHPTTLMARNNLAASCARINRHDEALELGERAFADRKRVLGPDHPQTLNSRNNLANRYYAVGRYSDALDLDERSFTQRREVLGETHADTLMSRNNMAVSYAAVGRYEDALNLDEQTWVDTERVLGPNHPDTLTSRHNLAIRHASVGHYEQGAEYARSVLADRERVLGHDHPDALVTRNLIKAIEELLRRDTEASTPDKQPSTVPTSSSPAPYNVLQSFDRRLESLGLEDLV
jgi:tetratricopeptide (TPR) repeat protein